MVSCATGILLNPLQPLKSSIAASSPRTAANGQYSLIILLMVSKKIIAILPNLVRRHIWQRNPASLVPFLMGNISLAQLSQLAIVALAMGDVVVHSPISFLVTGMYPFRPLIVFRISPLFIPSCLYDTWIHPGSISCDPTSSKISWSKLP